MRSFVKADDSREATDTLLELSFLIDNKYLLCQPPLFVFDNLHFFKSEH